METIFRSIFKTNRRLLLEKDLSKINLDDYQKVLIVGSGNDPYRNLFKENMEKYIRFDIESYDGKTDIVGDILNSKLEDESFDCIFAIEVMEHLENPFIFASEIKRILTNNGLLVVSVPFIFHLHADPSDFWRPTKMGLLHLFKDFSDIKIKSQGNRFHSILDLLSTSFGNNLLFRLIRAVNIPLSFFYSGKSLKDSSGTTGYLLTAKK